MRTNIKDCFLTAFVALTINVTSCAQNTLTITNPESGLTLSVINQNYPLLKLLLPGQPVSDRGIEIEFPEHVTGMNNRNGKTVHLYLVTRGGNQIRTLPHWEKKNNTLTYESILNNNVRIRAIAKLNNNGLSYSYEITNNSNISYENLQAVTCVKLYDDFGDTLLERTYVHHPKGFELIASETPERLIMPLDDWLPCRYLVSYTWPVPSIRKEKIEGNITRYYKSQKSDKPIIATVSRDKKWIAATTTRETGNLWTNPERTCHHADPSVNIHPGETKLLSLKTLVIRGQLEDLLDSTLHQ